MKKILLIYVPSCTPAVAPYSITHLYSFLKNNCKHKVEVLDLNLEFHKKKFPEYHEYCRNMLRKGLGHEGRLDLKEYEKKTKEYNKQTVKAYSENNKKVIRGEDPELLDEMAAMIREKKPDIVAFSIVYSSQAFYAYAMIKRLREDMKDVKKDFEMIIGGPSVNERLVNAADKCLNNEIEMLDYIKGTKSDCMSLCLDYSNDFSMWDLDDYFCPEPVIPIKTSTACPYRGCTFCTHFKDSIYLEFSLDSIRKTIVESGKRNFFLIDDMIPAKRLLEIAKMMKNLNKTRADSGIRWTCQLKPTKDLDAETLRVLRESGLTMIIWGVESGNDRILRLMNKGTNTKDIARVLSDSHNVGIKNVAYILFGFPTETKEELLETIDFLDKNKENIDLVSVSVFGLQKNTEIYRNPEKFGITKIIEQKRTILEPKISYELKDGEGYLSQKEAVRLKERTKSKISRINKYPDAMNFFREHMLAAISAESSAEKKHHDECQ